MEIFFNLQIDCEATHPAVNDPALGERAILGLAELLSREGLKATFVVVPSDMQVHAAHYRQLEQAGHEVGVHCHPATQGYQEFLGVYGFDEQYQIIQECVDIFAQEMGHLPKTFTPGYCSANDFTFPVLERLGFTHGHVSLPTRDLPQCACVWGSSPLDAHYPHRFNRCLTGNVNFIDVPSTIDPQSRMWGGAHPQDLRVELVDAKNHWYTIDKAVKRQLAAADKIPVKYIKASTHNIFDYSDERDFRRETLLGILSAARQIIEGAGGQMIPATVGDIARKYRELVPLLFSEVELKLDTRGRSGWNLGVEKNQ
jgi:hypothetical protein